MTQKAKFEVLYGPLVDVCKAHGISRTNAFKLANEGLLETFMLGSRRYVYVSSVHSLPERLGLVARKPPAQG